MRARTATAWALVALCASCAIDEPNEVRSATPRRAALTEIFDVDCEGLPDVVVLDSDIDVRALRAGACTAIGGDLVITGAVSGEVDLPALTRIDGDLRITESGVTSLVLGGLVAVGGDLEILFNDDLSAVDLTTLTAVRGVLVQDNPVLASLEWNELVSTSGDLRLEDLPALTTLSSSSLESVLGTLVLRNNDGLTDLSSFDSLGEVLQDVILVDNDELSEISLESLRQLDGSIVVSQHDKLRGRQPLSALTAVTGWVDVRHNPALDSMTLLSSLESVSTGIYLIDLPQLSDLQGLNMALTTQAIEVIQCGVRSLRGLETVSGLNTVVLARNANLTGLADIPRNVNNLSVVNNDALTDLSTLPTITAMDSVLVLGNASMTTLSMSGLTRVMFGLRVAAQPLITDLGLNDLVTVGNLTFERLPLTRVRGLTSLTTVGELLLDQLPQFQEFTGLGSLASVTSVRLVNVDTLDDMSTFPPLAEVGDLEIRGCNDLSSLAGLEGLLRLNDDLVLVNNSALTDISALGSVTVIGDDVTITNNSLLPQCQIDDLTGNWTVGGMVTSFSNGPSTNCN